jgi:hypothetical protein
VKQVAWGRYTVPTGQVWLFGTKDPPSWDSRYFGRCRRARCEPRWSRFSHGELWRTDYTPESRDLESIISRISAAWSQLRGWTVSRPTCCSVDYLNSQHVCPTSLLHGAPRSLQWPREARYSRDFETRLEILERIQGAAQSDAFERTPPAHCQRAGRRGARFGVRPRPDADTVGARKKIVSAEEPRRSARTLAMGFVRLICAPVTPATIPSGPIRL